MKREKSQSSVPIGFQRLVNRLVRARRRDSARKLLASLAGQITLQGIIVTLLAAPLLAFSWRELTRDVLIIDPIGVPKSFAEAGLSPEVMANRLRVKLLDIESSTQTKIKKEALNTSSEEAKIPEIELPGTKLGLSTIINLGRILLGHTPKHVVGDIILPVNSTQKPGAEVSAVLTIYFSSDSTNSHSLSGVVNASDLAGIVQRLADLSLRQINPYLLAAYYEQNDQLGEAMSIARTITLIPSGNRANRIAAFILLANLLDRAGKHSEAIANYTKALELDPSNTDAYNGWGNALYATRCYEDAVVKYARAIELDQANTNAYNGWGNVLYKERRYEDAVAKYAATIKRDSKNTNAYNGWANSLEREGKHQAAILKYSESIAIDPKNTTAYNGWASVLEQEGKHQEAILKYSESIAIDPKDATAYNGWASVLEQEGKHQAAILQYSKSIAIDPKNADSHVDLGDSLAEIGRHSESMKQYADALAIDPDNVRAYTGLGNELAKQRRDAEAVTNYAKAIKLEPNAVNALNGWGNVLIDEGKYVDACEKFARAAEVDPRRAFYRSWAEALRKSGRPKDADEKLALGRESVGDK